ncbi:glycoside hydrolase family 20 protein [Streptomyces sp. RFCAC02]|uniref:beta-N-acetylhexosaminidase n=1 Tax=Streptomyces sp. RFCAC02 TaxID=2499143 RepID=UPI001021DA0A|nr:glycoside hydrolase family 20 protein [Streptomyces sp. RFCAC02]
MRQAPWRLCALAVAALTIVVAASLVIAEQGGDGTGTERSGPAAATPPEASQSPDPDDLPDGPRGEPRVIPAVRSFDAADGDGWAPAEGVTRVVADGDGPLDDEADRLADEIGAERADDGARAGDVVLKLDDDADTGGEGYRLVTEDHRVTITGRAQAGVFYGTRTVAQAVRGAGGLPEGTAWDRPDRPQRGLLLDTARKPFSADWIKARLTEMADLKLNQLQLHFSDDQGFRVASESHPEVASDDALTKDEVEDILRLARDLHITVIPEIDSPGHLGAVLAAHPEFALKRADGTVTEGAVDIANPEAGELIDDLLREYAELFPGDWVHVGGDEYVASTVSDPEGTYPDLAREARDRFGDDAGVRDLATAWINDRADAVRDAGKTPQVWNDGMHAGGTVKPDEDRQVTYWTGREYGAREPVEYLEGGWPVLNHSSEYLYYVLGEPNDFTYPTGERIYEEWTPAVLRGTEPVPERFRDAEHIPGARFGVWCDLSDAQTPEQVADGIRMPLAALSQKVWDPGEPKLSWDEFSALAGEVVPAR